MNDSPDTLSRFHPIIRGWFAETYGTPTDIQAQSWPGIADGKNLLITAPTGSGKTLTAFLWAINQFVCGQLSLGTTRVLYISPLKALNNDIQRNLISPLEQLKLRFDLAGEDFPDIRVRTRSGDTRTEDRRRMLRHPPEILITTPESLNLLLSSKSGEGLLHGLSTVILDEIHGVVGNKRGVYLMSAVERLVPLSGEFQRLALSATVKPLDTIAAFVAGYRLAGTPQEPVYEPRAIDILSSPTQKRYDIRIRLPAATGNRGEDEEIWESMAQDFVERIQRNRATLLFTNSRALCEKLTHWINQAAGHTLAYAHHGSLSREIRFEVEQKLKAGDLAAIVATSTLEMGIDIGSLDEVILVQSPDAVSSAIQRIGRAGHGVGEVSRCTVYPTHPLDFLEAAVLGKAVMDRDIEPIRTVECPLDVLAQVMISMTGMAEWDIDELFAELRRSTPYHRLTQRQFELVLSMLAGRYADNHIRELKPRISIDRLSNRVTARPGALMSLYLSGGVIPDRGYFQLRHQDSNAKIGELDEEFVWEATVGKVFSFGTQTWQIKKITHNDVVVGPAKPSGIAPPFWKAEPLSRDFHYANRVGEFLEYANTRTDDDAFTAELVADYCMEDGAAKELHSFLKRQKEHVHSDLPHRHHLLVERVNSAPGRASGHQVVLHTGWGSRVNRPLAMALEAGWFEAHGEMAEVFVTNESLVIQLPRALRIEEVLAMVPANQLEARLRQRLEGSGFFGARFRENAGRALLLSKGRFNERKPLWMSRLQSQKLMDSVLKFEDFPMLLETWRTCLQDEFDIENLRMLLAEIESGELAITEVTSSTPSPFAQGVAWDQINTYMYMTDTPKAAKTSNLSSSLLEEVVFNPGLRPVIPLNIKTDFEERRQRRLPGYEPETEAELLEWVKERTAIPSHEWWPVEIPALATTLAIGDARLIVAREDETSLTTAFMSDDEGLVSHLANFLQYYGPVTADELSDWLGVDKQRLEGALNDLLNEQTLIQGQLLDGSDEVSWCDAENFETLLRFMRQSSRREFTPLPAAALPGFLHHWQTRYSNSDPVEQTFEALERLRCLPVAPALWESELLPARLPGYDPQHLDLAFSGADILWLGNPAKQVTPCFKGDVDLLSTPAARDADIDMLLPDSHGRYSFSDILDRTGATAHDTGDKLWQAFFSGHVTNDSPQALRKGIEQNFQIPEPAPGRGTETRRHVRRRGFNQWRSSIPFAGNWYQLARPEPPTDLLDREELNKDRVRVLMDRYGILFRELLLREEPAFRWALLFRSIRLMELAGEMLSGYFFEDLPGPQFVSPEAFRTLQRPLPADKVFWVNATDPVSMCGIAVDAFRAGLPRRVPGNHVVYHDDRVVLVSERSGKSLTINVAADDENLPRYLDVLRHLVYRATQPVRKLTVESINGEPATRSEYLDTLSTVFNISHDYKAIYVERSVL